MKRFSFLAVALVMVLSLPGALTAQDVKSLVDKGVASMEDGHIDQALQSFNQALKLKPNDPALYDYRGMAYRVKGQDDLALQDFNKAMELDPRFARAYRNRAMVYYDRTDYEKSVADLEKAQSLGYRLDQDFVKMARRKAAEKK